MSDDRELAQELLAGWPVPEGMVEVGPVVCVKGADRVDATVVVGNPNDFSWAYGVEFVFYTRDGEVISGGRSDPGYWRADEEVELSNWMVPVEDFDDDPRCEVKVFHGTPLAFRREELRADTYERLGWDPVAERRVDGS